MSDLWYQGCVNGLDGPGDYVIDIGTITQSMSASQNNMIWKFLTTKYGLVFMEGESSNNGNLQNPMQQKMTYVNTNS